MSWRAIASTESVAALDNTLTNPGVDGEGGPIFLLDGTSRIAAGNSDLLSGSISVSLKRTEEKTIRSTAGPLYGGHGAVWTGTGPDGKRSSPLGTASAMRFGLHSAELKFWVSRGSVAEQYGLPMYGLSLPLRVQGPLGASVLIVK